MSVNLVPAPGKYIIQLDPQEEMTAGGLYLPGTAIKDGNFGTVVAVNSERPYRDKHGHLVIPACAVDSRVVIGRYAGVRIEHDGQEYVIVSHDEILACVEPVAVS